MKESVMRDPQELATRSSGEPQTQSQPQARESDYVLIPPADIYEDADGISVVLDMPGVAKDRLNVKADRNGLLVEGDAQISMAEGMEAVYADVRATRYRRNFGLTSELDTDHTEATLKDGVLTIRIPKRAELKPRRIEVKAG
jgi:HSP20 family protein